MGVTFPGKKRYVTLEWPLCMSATQALIQDQISTSPIPRTVDAQRGRHTDIYILLIILQLRVGLTIIPIY